MADKKVYRYFWIFMKKQENWLNSMAKSGLRLVKTGMLSYEFDRCGEGEYEYRIDFAAHLSEADLNDYADFLESMGYVVFHKNVNLNYAVGKVTVRPYGKGRGKIATSGGTINKELLIIEKKSDGTPFELRTTNSDKADYMALASKAWLWWAGYFLAFFVFWLIIFGKRGLVFSAVFLCLGIIQLIPAAVFGNAARKYRQMSEISEE
ncbi:MAG: DUF2812 domain-containing protein [Ruminococcus sp.]|nr:DUF2812 domain-containing protein [Ruminococcus sp.]